MALSSGPSSRASTPGRILNSRQRRRQAQAQAQGGSGTSGPQDGGGGLDSNLDIEESHPAPAKDRLKTPLPVAADSPQPGQSALQSQDAGIRLGQARKAVGAAHEALGDGAPGDGGRADAELRRAAAARRQAKSVSPVLRQLGRPARGLAQSLELGGNLKEEQLRGRVGRRSAEHVRREAALVCSRDSLEAPFLNLTCGRIVPT